MTDTAIKQGIGRRDFLFVASGATVAIGAAAASWPLVDQMEPSAGVVAAGEPVSVDLSSLLPGQQVIVLWRSMPVFIVRRTREILAALKSQTHLMQLRDPGASEHQQPDYAKNWSRSINPEYLVLVGICTHLGCIPAFSPQPGSLSPAGANGYLCHCHGSKYDMAGRVFKGVPAPFNLPVPPHHFSAPRMLVIGENPPGETFDLSSVSQI